MIIIIKIVEFLSVNIVRAFFVRKNHWSCNFNSILFLISIRNRFICRYQFWTALHIFTYTLIIDCQLLILTRLSMFILKIITQMTGEKFLSWTRGGSNTVETWWRTLFDWICLSIIWYNQFEIQIANFLYFLNSRFPQRPYVPYNSHLNLQLKNIFRKLSGIDK